MQTQVSQSIYVTTIKFWEVAASVVHMLMELPGDQNNLPFAAFALDTISFGKLRIIRDTTNSHWTV